MSFPPSSPHGDTEPLDLIVIGGGITGAGVARDAALRGLRVALFDKGDFASGTSSKSSKLIHGGLRYLEHGQLGLVFESVRERAVQLRVAPHLVTPLSFLIPVYRGARHGLEKLNLGLWLYDTLALFRTPKLHKTYRGAGAADLEPGLRRDELRGIIEYADCMTDDARLVLENVLDACALGATCSSYHEVIGLERDPRGRVCGVRVRDLHRDQERLVATRAVIVAAGPWTDALAGRLGVGVGERRILRPTKGVHAVFPAERLPISHAVSIVSPIDGRVMFAMPWRGRVYLGTTDTDFDGSVDEVHADAADVRYLCDSVNHYFPAADLRPEQVIATWAGLRPLVDDGGAHTASAVSREHELIVRDDGIVIVAGGKLTTYRRMAEQVVRAALGWLFEHEPEAMAGRDVDADGTKKRPLPGAEGLSGPGLDGVDALAAELAGHGIEPASAAHLARVYGSRARLVLERIEADPDLGAPMQADLPHLWAEVAVAVEHDLARTLEDVLARRIPLLLIGRDQGLDVVDRVADIMAATLGWSGEHRGRQVAAYRAAVADSRRFRTELGPARVSEPAPSRATASASSSSTTV
ncbi:FAD-dependent oxidoreductase [Haliangium sp.]|uniref:glycerol-3-phosphate dehydrogenase/oxidase n=1 Tax=Haliangium sp. TaxID=2663208 RepID=UPI003D0AC88F